MIPIYIDVVHVRNISHLYAFANLGWRVVGHGWDALGSFTSMAFKG